MSHQAWPLSHRGVGRSCRVVEAAFFFRPPIPLFLGVLWFILFEAALFSLQNIIVSASFRFCSGLIVFVSRFFVSQVFDAVSYLIVSWSLIVSSLQISLFLVLLSNIFL